KQKHIHAVTFFGGFPLSDLAETGTSVVIVAEDSEIAQRVATEFAADVWAERKGFVYHERPLSESVEAAREASLKPGKGPILMLDHGDNCMSGGTCDIMDVLAESLRQGLTGILAGPVADAEAVAAMQTAGVGKDITLELGNRWSLPSIGVDKTPLELTGRVRTLAKGSYVITGPIYTDMHCDMGEAAVLETDQALILVVEEPHEPWDIGVFSCAGLDPAQSEFLILKSRMYCRPIFEPLSKQVVECASLGITSSRLELFDYMRLCRPVFPLDLNMSWAPHTIKEARN